MDKQVAIEDWKRVAGELKSRTSMVIDLGLSFEVEYDFRRKVKSEPQCFV